MLILVLILLTLVTNIEKGRCAPTAALPGERNVNLVFDKNDIPETILKVTHDRSPTKHEEEVEATTFDSLEVEDFISVQCVLSLVGGCGR